MRNVSDRHCRDRNVSNVVEKIKTHILCSTTSFQKPCHWQDNVEKCGRAKQATDDNITLCMHFARWITKATDTHSEYVILIAFPLQQWLLQWSPCHVIHTLPLFIKNVINRMAYLCETMLQKGKLLLHLTMRWMQHSVMRHNANQKNVNASTVKSDHELW